MITIRKIFKFLFNMKYYFIYWNRFKGLTKKQEKYITEKQFKWGTGYKINLDNPKSFNEKIQWLKLNYRNPLLTKCADKYAVREYVKEKIGEEYLIPLLGVWDSPDDIDFDSLPNQFVLKVNWGSGQNIIVKDKLTLNIEEAKEKLRNWLNSKSNHYYMGLEWCYKDIPPKIIAEKYMAKMSESLIDYKIFCNYGTPKFLFLGIDRFKDLKFNFYDLDWNLLPVKNHYEISEKPIQKPNNYNKMLEIAEILSKEFPHARVDLFEIEGTIYFGEITFYHFGGTEPFEPREWDYKFGDMIDIEPLMKGDNK